MATETRSLVITLIVLVPKHLPQFSHFCSEVYNFDLVLLLLRLQNLAHIIILYPLETLKREISGRLLRSIEILGGGGLDCFSSHSDVCAFLERLLCR